MRASHYRWTALLLGLVLAGCGAVTDGGPVGTGITASVVGNVIAVEDPSVLASLGVTASATDGSTDAVAPSANDVPTDGVANIEGIEVSLVEYPDVGATTDSDGNFSLDGEFAGTVTLRFRTTGLDVEQPLDVPSGGVVVLSDIQLAQEGITTEAGRQLGLEGSVRSVDCEAGTLEIADRRGERFQVTLTEETEFVRGGDAQTCADVTLGVAAEIEGLFEDGRGRSVVALVVTIDPESSGPPPVDRRVAFLGNVAAIDCDTGGLLVHDGQHGVRVHVSADTVIRDPRGNRLACGDLELGDRVTGGGSLNLKRPGVVQGLLLIVGSRLGPGAELPIRGMISATACGDDVLLIALDGAVVSVRLLPETRLQPKDATCDSLSHGYWWVRGRGVVSTEIPGGLDATELDFKRIQPPK